MGDFNIWGSSKKSEKKQPNIFGGSLDFGIGSAGENSDEIKMTNFKADFNYLMEIQKGKCVYPKCEKLHGKRQNVHSLRDLDHKFSVKLWELTKKKGNVNMRSNLQLLCPGCHRHKTAEDRKKISLYKEKPTENNNGKGDLFGGGNLFEKPPKHQNPLGFKL